MVSRIIEFCARNRFLVIFGVLFALAASLYCIKHTKLDAIPDLSDTQVIIYSRWDRSPDIMEDQVTYPIVTSMLGAPKVKAVKQSGIAKLRQKAQQASGDNDAEAAAAAEGDADDASMQTEAGAGAGLELSAEEQAQVQLIQSKLKQGKGKRKRGDEEEAELEPAEQQQQKQQPKQSQKGQGKGKAKARQGKEPMLLRR